VNPASPFSGDAVLVKGSNYEIYREIDMNFRELF
jgi:hypothetical protein